MGTTDLEQHAAVYDSTNIFAVGTAHHAAETGSLDELAAAEAAGKARGYPALVTMETRDDILQCVPLHVAAEKGQHNVVQVGPPATSRRWFQLWQAYSASMPVRNQRAPCLPHAQITLTGLKHASGYLCSKARLAGGFCKCLMLLYHHLSHFPAVPHRMWRRPRRTRWERREAAAPGRHHQQARHCQAADRQRRQPHQAGQ